MKLDKNKIPKHIAIIMDGNGRWSEKHGLPKILGHRKGVKTIEEVMRACKDIGVHILTLYAFSTENWKRPKNEVDALMKLLETYLKNNTMKLKKDGVRLTVIGDVEKLPFNVRDKLKNAIVLTADNDSFVLNLALNYGSRHEITEAARSIAREVKNEKMNLDDIDENMFSKFLYTRDLPDPDMLIRTSGEMRVSNFLLWQISYAEIYVTKTLWPDFTRKDFEKAIVAFQKRDRRFGGR